VFFFAFVGYGDMARGKVGSLAVTQHNEKVVSRAAWCWSKEREAKADGEH